MIVREIAYRFHWSLDSWEKGEIDDNEFAERLHKIDGFFTLLTWFIMKIGVEEDEDFLDVDSIIRVIEKTWEEGRIVN